MMEPMAVDEIPTDILRTFIQHHQQRLSELQDELQLRNKLQIIKKEVEDIQEETR